MTHPIQPAYYSSPALGNRAHKAFSWSNLAWRQQSNGQVLVELANLLKRVHHFEQGQQDV
jgi:hypothetical protein